MFSAGWAGRFGFFAVLGVFFFLPTAFAQPADSLPPIEKKRPNSLKPGAWAFQFQISDNFRSFSGLQGFGVSLKYHFSRTKALRFGVGAGHSNSDFDATGRSLQADTIRVRRISDSENNVENVDFAAQYVFYVAPDADVCFFFGSGPLVRFGHSEYQNEESFSYATANGVRNYVSDEDRWNVGFSGLSGAEWFATKSISFHAEYGLSFEYQSTSRTSWGIETWNDSSGTQTYSFENEDNGNSFRFNLASVKFGLSVYF